MRTHSFAALATAVLAPGLAAADVVSSHHRPASSSGSSFRWPLRRGWGAGPAAGAGRAWPEPGGAARAARGDGETGSLRLPGDEARNIGCYLNGMRTRFDVLTILFGLLILVAVTAGVMA
jgi:hypothetical protein